MDNRSMIGRFMESETGEFLMREMYSSFSISQTDEHEAIMNLFSPIVSYIGEKEVENLRKQFNIPCFLSCLFGTEECVNLIRGLGLLRENLYNEAYRNTPFRMITSGSLGDGVVYPSSDDDIMFICMSYYLVQQSNKATENKFLLLVPSDCSPGYCLLLDVGGLCNRNILSVINERPFISSTLFKEMVQHACNDSTIHGPCLMLTSDSMNIDAAPCIMCPFWPNVAKEWIDRDRHYKCPSLEMIQSIVRNGCHVVPIGNPDSDYRDHEWRISFSLAERTLVHSFNHAQFLMYNVLRYALKLVIEKQFPDVLCSYFMKTTLFHTIERTPRQMWREDNLEICYIVCLSVLFYFIDNKKCPNYFIPKYNMIKKKVNDTNKQPLLDLVRHLIKVRIFGVVPPFWIIAYFNKSLLLKSMECKHDRIFFQSYQVNLLTFFFIPRSFTAPFYQEEKIAFVFRILRYISQEMETQNPFLNTILHSGIMRICQNLMHHLWSSTKQNKLSYILHKMIQTLLHAFKDKGNVILQRLTKASYLHVVGKTRLGLLVIQKLLSKYPTYALECTMPKVGVQRYIKNICGIGYTMDYKARRVWAPHYNFLYFHLDAYPPPIKIWILTEGEKSLHPRTFALLLESLCHIQLQDVISLMKSTEHLLNHLGNLEDNYDIACARMCIGIIKFEHGDNHSAYKWFRSAYMIADKQLGTDSVSVSVLLYIACLVYKQLFQQKSN